MTLRQAQPVQLLAMAFQTAIAQQHWTTLRETGRKLAKPLPDDVSIAYNLALVEKSAGAIEAAGVAASPPDRADVFR